MVDMRPYYERLAEAMSERCEFTNYGSVGWVLKIKGSVMYAYICDTTPSPDQWAFWGPLADELKVRPHGFDEDGRAGTMTYDRDLSWLENIAEAVCQEAERRAGEA